MSTYYTSKYSGEQIDEAVEKMLEGGITGDYADRQLSNLDTPQAALANLGAGVRPNLLINPFFQVNQRGQTSYSGGASYFIDLWKLSDSAMSAQISDDHISITSASTYHSFKQRIENYKELFGKTLTLSALVKGVSGNTVGIAIGNTNTSTGVCFRERFTCTGNWQLITMTFTLSEISSGDTYLDVMCYPEFTTGGTGGTSDWMAAKLEEGSTQTLAYQDDTGAWQLLPQPESDYATQLAKCQRYLQLTLAGEYRASYVSANSIVFVVPTPVTMRVAPTIIGDFLVKTIGGTTQTGFTFSTLLRSGCIRISATKTAHGLTDAMLNIQSNFDGFTAEL